MLDLKDLFEDTKNMLFFGELSVEGFKGYRFHFAQRMLRQFLNYADCVVKRIFPNRYLYKKHGLIIDKVQMTDMLRQLLEAQENKDYILIVDLVEMQWNPFFCKLQGNIIEIIGFQPNPLLFQDNIDRLRKVNLELAHLAEKAVVPEDYQIVPTATGMPTLKFVDGEKSFYLHSAYKPIQEAAGLAASILEEGVHSYIIYGIGLGYLYHVLFFLEPAEEVQIYESDIVMIKLWLTWFDLRWFFELARYQIVYDPDFDKISKGISNMSGDTGFVIHEPSLKKIQQQQSKERLEIFFHQMNAWKNQKREMEANFLCNVCAYDSIIDELRQEFIGKTIYIVAGGPSLDKNVNQLKNISDSEKQHSIILATSTVFKKLLALDILPNYVITSDAGHRTHHKLKGYCGQEVGLIFLSTATYRIAKEYSGRKYIAFQKDYPLAEAYAAEHDSMLFLTGGSVSTFALDVAISFGARRIVFCGLDLAYTQERMHASHTTGIAVASHEGLIEVEDITGGKVFTSTSLNNYRRWIEKRIDGLNHIEIIDATEGGAKIQGMEIQTLEYVIQNEK